MIELPSAALMIDETTHTTATLSWEDEFSGVPYSVDYSITGSDDGSGTKVWC